MNRALALSFFLLLPACATLRPSPPSGPMCNHNGAQGNDGAKLREARTLFASAKQLNQNFLQAYVQEAALDLAEEKYADAWEEVAAAERIDAHGVDPDLLAELETRMPRPTR